ncbi:MAG: hypothetical protein HY764_02085 [Candidatus Portnoybacteria bacterium]|nr:hypothetical protein [Candidatus Portnoybacteria bacterium]
MWETIKRVLQKQKGTCIIIEEGKPAYVVVSFSEYQKFLDSGPEPREPFEVKVGANISEEQLLEKINQEITDWKVAQVEEQAAQRLAEEALDEEVKIEDLPI